jgi:hypothetical protein
MRLAVIISLSIYMSLCIGTRSLSAAEKKFSTSVSWQAFDNSGPKNPTVSSVDWKIVDDILIVCEVESCEWVKCMYLGQETLQSGAVGIMHTGKLSNGRRFSLTVIKSGSKFYYSLATTRGQEEHITYGPGSDELKQYFFAHIK